MTAATDFNDEEEEKEETSSMAESTVAIRGAKDVAAAAPDDEETSCMADSTAVMGGAQDVEASADRAGSVTVLSRGQGETSAIASSAWPSVSAFALAPATD